MFINNYFTNIYAALAYVESFQKLIEERHLDLLTDICCICELLEVAATDRLSLHCKPLSMAKKSGTVDLCIA